MNEYLTSNQYIAFPFRDNASGVDRDGLGNQLPPDPPSLPANAVLDMLVTYYGGEQLYLKRTYCDSLGVGFISVEDEAGSFAISLSFTDLSQLDYGNVVSGQNQSNGTTARLVAGSGLRPFIENGVKDDAVDFGTSLPLVDAAMDTKPYKVRDFSVLGTAGIKGTVNFVPGYNMEIDYDPVTSEITFAVIPGASLGRVNPCDEAVAGPIDFLASFNGKRATDGGGMILSGDGGCYRTVQTASGMEIYNDCEACCSCSDYENVAKALQILNDRLKAIKVQLAGGAPLDAVVTEGMIKVHNDDVEYFNKTVLPELTKLRIYGGGHRGHVDDIALGKGGGNHKYAIVTVNFHAPAVGMSVTYSCVFNGGVYELFDGWLTVGENTGGAGAAGGLVLDGNEVGVLTLMIKKVPILEDGVLTGYEPFPSSVTVTADWSFTDALDPEDCVDVPTSGQTVKTLTIG